VLTAARSSGEWIAGGAFIALAVAHAVVRLKFKAGRARHRERGMVYHGATFDRMMTICFALFAAAILEWASGLWTLRVTVSAVGLAIYVFSSLLQWRAFRDLGNAYSPDIEVRAEQPLVQTGLYRVVRHPLLCALILEMLGSTLFLNAYIAFVLVVIVVVPVVWMRLKEEEAVLLRHFGESYVLYSRHVGALFPKRLIDRNEGEPLWCRH
jgi:protein-S-isoprenylcysteine O-methyltransferase Ste14